MDDITLNNGLTLPPIGFGVFQSSPEDTVDAVRTALEVGYRHIDTAAAYGNERQVGEAIRASDVDRDDIVVETKVFPTDYGYDETLHAFEKATGKLGIDTIDVLILHQPAPDRFDRTVQAYKALETLYADGKVRAIGVSNFMPHHLRSLLEQSDVIPALNQIELHPYFTQPDVQRADAEHGILDQAWSPIGGITFYPGWGADERVSVMEDPTIREIAEVHGKTPAQVMLRWHVQQGRNAIPKSTNPGRIAENFDVFDFALSDDELGRLDGLDTGRRSGPDPDGDSSRFDARTIPEA
jgi:2,5-diketo-D-gluconate reductase A